MPKTCSNWCLSCKWSVMLLSISSFTDKKHLICDFIYPVVNHSEWHFNFSQSFSLNSGALNVPSSRRCPDVVFRYFRWAQLAFSCNLLFSDMWSGRHLTGNSSGLTALLFKRHVMAFCLYVASVSGFIMPTVTWFGLNIEGTSSIIRMTGLGAFGNSSLWSR